MHENIWTCIRKPTPVAALPWALVTPATDLYLQLFKSWLLAKYIFLCHKICYLSHKIKTVLCLGSTLCECQNRNQRNILDPSYLKAASMFPSFPTQMSCRCISQGDVGGKWSIQHCYYLLSILPGGNPTAFFHAPSQILADAQNPDNHSPVCAQRKGLFMSWRTEFA